MPLADFLIVAALILVNGFFVAAEFALVAARGTRIDQLAAGGSLAARLVQRAKADPNRFISAAQIGITVASLLLGWLGEEAFAKLLDPPLEQLLPGEIAGITARGVASALAIVLVTILHVTLGEQVPKMLALNRAESLVLIAAPPTDFIARALSPFIWLLGFLTDLVLRAMRLEYRAEEHGIHSPEELRLLIGHSARAGLLTGQERELVDRAFAFGDLTAGEVMVPRTEVTAIPITASTADVLRLALRHRHSRFPVYESSIDNVVGVLSAKDLLAVAARRGPTGRPGQPGQPGQVEINLRRLMRPPVIVPQGAEVAEVLKRMKAARQPLAVVLDEYGGTAGIVTLKDLVVRLLGEVGDEYAPAHNEVRLLADGTALVDGLALVEDVNAQLATRFDTSEVDTIGGLVFSEIGRRPTVGDEVPLGGGWRGRVERLDGLRIARVRLLPPQVSAEPPAAPPRAPADAAETTADAPEAA